MTQQTASGFTQQQDSKGELRAAFTMRELRNAKRSFPMGSTGIFLRVTLAVIFMYLIVIAYLLMGIVGSVLVSSLFLIAFFVPVLIQIGKGFWRNRKAQDVKNDKNVDTEARLDA